MDYLNIFLLPSILFKCFVKIFYENKLQAG